MTNTTILAIGSTGKTGKRVADQLDNHGVTVRHGSRSADIPFDWDNPQTWAAALAGVDKVYLTYYPTSARAHGSTRCWQAPCHCQSTMCRSRSWTPTTSPRSRWPR